jgi:NADP-dependent 3-hydroxy acid dehydrogenase YdfG
MKPVVDRLEQQYKGKVEFKRFDVDNSAEGNQLMTQFNAKYVPTFVFLNKDGSVSGQKVGETSEADMKKALDALN